ncbi:MAG TPA: ABC transporter ATP-binding protein [Candidatus Obscuribacterales bacterium]
MLRDNRLWLIVKTGWHFAGKYRIAMLVCTVLFMIAQAVALLEPYVLGLMLNAVQSDLTAGDNGKLLHDVIWYMGLFFALKFGFWAIHGPTRLLERYVAFHITFAYKAHMFKSVTQMPLRWQRLHHSGESIDKINRAHNALSDFFQGSFDIVYMVCRLIGTLIILQFFMPLAALAVIVTTAIALYVIIRFDGVLSKQYDELNKQQNYIAEAIHDYITNIVTVITLRLEPRTLEEVKRRMMLPLPLFRKNNFLNESKWFLTSIMITAMTGIVLIGYTYSTLAGGGIILAGTLFSLFDYLRRIGDSFYNFASQYGRVVRQAADLKAANAILEDLAALTSGPVEASLPQGWQKVSVRELNFAYQDAQDKRQHLKNVGIDLEMGKAIAIVGPSGSGKSTLLRLLRGLDMTDDVRVSADGSELKHKLRHLATTTTLMPQDPEIFADTIRFNIAFGMEASDGEIMSAIRAARFDEVLARLPKGLETNIAEKGINLSGGEKQRLALARGIFFARSSDILLLDEPTSSVDTTNERLIYTHLLGEFRKRCLVSTVHKLHLLELFDVVYVLDNGEVVEVGSFKELIAAKGKLAQLWENYQAASQASGSQIV